jgi:hypothetical protein
MEVAAGLEPATSGFPDQSVDRSGNATNRHDIFRDNFGTIEKWELSGFSGVSDTNEAI